MWGEATVRNKGIFWEQSTVALAPAEASKAIEYRRNPSLEFHLLGDAVLVWFPHVAPQTALVAAAILLASGRLKFSLSTALAATAVIASLLGMYVVLQRYDQDDKILPIETLPEVQY